MHSLAIEVWEEEDGLVATAPWLDAPIRAKTWEQLYELAMRARRHVDDKSG